jgi:hypothetical protein
MFGKELQKVGVGAPVTKMEIKEFEYKYDEHFVMHIYDTWGLEPSIQSAEKWKSIIFNEIDQHDKKNISDWFNTIIFCLNAKSSRIEDFELDIMEKLLREKNHLTIALTHCTTQNDPDGHVLKASVKDELKKRGIDSIEDRNFVFVSNVKKKLIGASVDQFGREEIFISIIRNVWASLKSKVPYQARKQFEDKFRLKKDELLKKPDKLRWVVPFMKMSSISRLEREINRNCTDFVKELVKKINDMYNDAIVYYSELSKKYAIVGFQLNSEDFATSAEIHFDAMQTVEKQVSADLKRLKKRMLFLNTILNDKNAEDRLREAIKNFRIMVRDGKNIRRDLKDELNRYMDTVKKYLDDHLDDIEKQLNSLEIDDLYMFQTNRSENASAGSLR